MPDQETLAAADVVSLECETMERSLDVLVQSAILGAQAAMKDSAGATVQASNEALQFECEMLRREASRLITANRTLEARLALAESERDRLRQYVRAIERSRFWRFTQMLRGWLGRRW